MLSTTRDKMNEKTNLLIVLTSNLKHVNSNGENVVGNNLNPTKAKITVATFYNHMFF